MVGEAVCVHENQRRESGCQSTLLPEVTRDSPTRRAQYIRPQPHLGAVHALRQTHADAAEGGVLLDLGLDLVGDRFGEGLGWGGVSWGVGGGWGGGRR